MSTRARATGSRLGLIEPGVHALLEIVGGVDDEVRDQLLCQGSAGLEPAQHVADHRGVAFGLGELGEHHPGAAGEGVELVLVGHLERLSVARLEEALTRAVVVDDQTRADPGVLGDGTQWRAEPVDGEALQSGAKDALLGRWGGFHGRSLGSLRASNRGSIELTFNTLYACSM